jgi:hypothetical protein
MLSNSVILVSHGEWVNMRDLIRIARRCKNTFPLVTQIALDIIKKLYKSR